MLVVTPREKNANNVYTFTSPVHMYRPESPSRGKDFQANFFPIIFI